MYNLMIIFINYITFRSHYITFLLSHVKIHTNFRCPQKKTLANRGRQGKKNIRYFKRKIKKGKSSAGGYYIVWITGMDEI